MARMKATWIAASLLLILILSIALPVLAQEPKPEMSEKDGWKVVKTDIITLMFPSEGNRPIFIWWYTKKNETVYVVDFKGLWEYAVFNLTESTSFKRKNQLEPGLINQTFIKPYMDGLEKRIKDHASTLRENISRSMDGINTYLMMFKDFEDYSKEFGCNGSSYIDEIVSASISLNASLSFMQETSGRISEETAAKRVISLSYDLENETKKIPDYCSSIEGEINELVDYVGNWTGGGTDKLNKMLMGCREDFSDAMTLVNDVLENEELLRGEVSKLEAEITDFNVLVEQWDETWHLPFLPFHACEWNLTDIRPIKTAEGEEIGLAFAYILQKVHIPHFEFAENNVILRCRFYYVPVEETMDNVTYTVIKAELKMDFIVLTWHWLLEKTAATLEEKYNVTIPIDREGLALWANLISLNATKLEGMGAKVYEAAQEIEVHTKTSVSTCINVTGVDLKERIDIKANATLQDERKLGIPPGFGEQLKLSFATENTTLAGYFRFINAAKVTYPNGTKEAVQVRGAYLEAGGYLMLFICYPYFNGGTLEHDPSIGLTVTETTTTEATTPKYTTSTSTDPREVTPPPEGIKPVIIGVTSTNVIAVGLTVTAAAVTAIFLLKKRRIVNNI